MANRSPVPKFGDWKEDAAFTVVFDKVSKSNSKNNINMSNPNEYPDMTPDAAQNRNYRHDDQRPNHNERPRHERLRSREETEYRSSPAHNQRNDRVRHIPSSETYNHPSYGGGGRSVGNPSETNRRYPQETVQAQPRPIPNLRNQRKDRVVSIPPFPGSGSDNQSYTLIFDKVKEDRNQSARSYNGISDSTPTRPINDQHPQPLPSSPKGCCFPPWSRKGSYRR